MLVDADLSALEKYDIMRLKRKYGFLTNGYTDSVYYMEIVILFRKFSIVLIAQVGSYLGVEG